MAVNNIADGSILISSNFLKKSQNVQDELIMTENFRQFLGTRQQNANSDECNVEYGVPQGSVLGSLLFLIYVNDIVTTSTIGKFVLYADDTNIFISGTSENEVNEKAQIVLINVYDYICSQTNST